MSQWKDGIQPGTIGARMIELAEKPPFLDGMDLYNLVTNEKNTETVRVLAAKLYVAKAEYSNMSYRLNRLGEPISIGPREQLMRCAEEHLWVRSFERGDLACPTCKRSNDFSCATDPETKHGTSMRDELADKA